jgi:thiol-disulfide isomerase/thioredoxin
MNKLRTILWLLAIAMVCRALMGVTVARAAGEPPVVGGMLPELVLPVPQLAEEKAYLGLKSGNSFMIPQIAADVVILEIYSMYCPYCQKEAPQVNELYSLIAKRPNLRQRIKIIGIGAGNSAYEVKVFKDQYQVPFPLFADEDFKIHKLVGEVRTPCFIAIETRSDGWHRILYSRVGSIDDPQKFLDFLLKEVSGH